MGGEGGIRTLDTLADIQTFQVCLFNHSSTSPCCTSPLRERNTIGKTYFNSSEVLASFAYATSPYGHQIINLQFSIFNFSIFSLAFSHSALVSLNVNWDSTFSGGNHFVPLTSKAVVASPSLTYFIK